jgi:hypothetical protein
MIRVFWRQLGLAALDIQPGEPFMSFLIVLDYLLLKFWKESKYHFIISLGHVLG